MKNIVTQIVFLFVIAITFCGCASTDQRIVKLSNENKVLTKELKQSNRFIKELEIDKDFLKKEMFYYSKRSLVLEKERNTRVKSDTELRQGMRDFTDNMIKSLQRYYKKTELVDSLGSEVFKRSTIGDEKKSILIDLEHPFSNDGILIGGSAYFNKPGKLNFCILRAETKKTNRYRIVKVSDLFVSESDGLQNWSFNPPIAVKNGDLLAVYCPEDVIIPYDNVDTGNVILLNKSAEAGKYITVKPTTKRGKRAYSFAVTGFMN